jgi:hypothetical protein
MKVKRHQRYKGRTGKIASSNSLQNRALKIHYLKQKYQLQLSGKNLRSLGLS